VTASSFRAFLADTKGDAVQRGVTRDALSRLIRLPAAV
jgi:hypothetical protein